MVIHFLFRCDQPSTNHKFKRTNWSVTAYSFKLSTSDYYYQSIENLLNLEPDYITLLRDAELGEFDPGFTFYNIPGLSLWLDASQLSSAEASWNDRSTR